MGEKKEKVHKRLTIAELKSCEGFENYSDEQAEETIKSLEKLSILFYQLYMKQKSQIQKIKQLKVGIDASKEKSDNQSTNGQNRENKSEQRDAA
jgi:hypothetical protein